MNEVKKKNYDVKMPHYSNSAVDALGMHFNDMTAAMKTLINDTYKAKIMRQEMELEFIQQQMNPHFLFNVLSTVQIKAKMCGDETVYQMLASLSGLLRASLYSGKSMMTSLSEEVQYAEFLPISAKAEVPGPARLSYLYGTRLRKSPYSPGSPLNRLWKILCFMEWKAI